MSDLDEGPISILLVDDRPENLVSLGALLSSPDYRLVKANSGDEALRAVLNEDFALILLDVQMPKMDGFETAALIKKRPRSRHIPIIFITANSQDEQFIYRGYDAGAVDYILKPIAPDILRSKVAVFADLHRKTKQLVKFESARREQQANQRYRDLVSGLSHAIVWVADATSFDPTFVSDQLKSILGYAPSEVVKDPQLLYGAFPEDDYPRVLGALKQLSKTRDACVIEHRIVSRGGQVFWFQTELRIGDKPEHPGESEIRGLSIDITPIKAAESQAIENARSRDEFLSVASHELKTPLTSLKLQVQGLRRFIARGEPAAVTEKIPAFAERCERQIERITRLVDDLLDLSRISNGKLQMTPENVDLTELAKEVLSRFSLDLAHAGCDVRLDAPAPVLGTWDRMRIEQVFTNLLTNAFKYGPAAPIDVSVHEESGTAILSVRDRGIGIPAEDQSRIFAQFERVATPRGPAGLGLGLYIANQIVHAHGGGIHVHSEPGDGATFIVRLPTAARVGMVTSAESEPCQPKQELG